MLTIVESIPQLVEYANTLLDDFPEWAELGDDETSRRSAWRLRVSRPLGDGELSLVRQSSSTGRPLGEAKGSELFFWTTFSEG
jgi:hypothetical protein